MKDNLDMKKSARRTQNFNFDQKKLMNDQLVQTERHEQKSTTIEPKELEEQHHRSQQ